MINTKTFLNFCPKAVFSRVTRNRFGRVDIGWKVSAEQAESWFNNFQSASNPSSDSRFPSFAFKLAITLASNSLYANWGLNWLLRILSRVSQNN